MKYMITVGDENASNDSINDPIYVNSDTDEIETVSISEDAPNSTTTTEELSDQARTSKQIRKECRNSGKAYITSSGKYVAARKITPLSECRAKCNTRFTFEMQQAIFAEYWSLGSYDKRTEFLSAMITVSDKKSYRPRSFESNKAEKFRMKTYAYFLEVNGQRLQTCKGCFLKTLDESEGMVKSVALKKRAHPAGMLIANIYQSHSRHRDDVNIIPAKSTLPFYCR